MKRRILIVKLAAIGDVVMALPLLSSLKGNITWICGYDVEPLLRATQLVDEIIPVDEKKLLEGSLFEKIGVVLKLWLKLFGRSFDLILTLNPDPRYRILTYPTFSKERRQLGKRAPGRYHCDHYLSLLDEGERSQQFPALHLPPNKVALKEKPIVILAPGGVQDFANGKGLRRWPVASYVEVAIQLLKENVHVVVIGSKADSWVSPHFASLPIHDTVGKLSLLELLALFQESALLITHDGGPLHLAKLSPCSILALFGPTNPSEFAVEGEKQKILWGGEKLSCRPCYNGKTYGRCQNNLCMASISPQRVLEEARKLL